MLYEHCCTLEGKGETQQEQAPLAAYSMCLDTLKHTHIYMEAYIHKDNWMITHADASNSPACYKTTKKTPLTLSHSGWFTGPWAHTVIRPQPFDKTHQIMDRNYFAHSPYIISLSVEHSN